MNDILDKSVMEVINQKYDKLFLAEKKVVNVVLKEPQSVVNMNVSALAKKSGVSVATVVRMCSHLGYQGYYQFRIILARDLGRKQAPRIDKEKETDDAMDIFQEYANDMLSIGRGLDKHVMQECVNLIKGCKQAHIMAMGNTAPLAQYMGFRLGRLGVKCTYNIAPEYFMNHVNLADEGDIVIAISQSGTSRTIVQGMELAMEKGLKSIGITGHRGSPVAELADCLLLSSREEESFNYYKNYAHLKETAVIDALLALVMNQDRIIEHNADKPEIILAENKY